MKDFLCHRCLHSAFETDDKHLFCERCGALQFAHIKKCHLCAGSGVVDSGGITPWDEAISVECPVCAMAYLRSVA